jgi:formylglycine-generating enzyme required for sulfatase activity
MSLIPSGHFRMGSNDGSGAEKPPHLVWVDAFYIDKHEVTNRQYGEFVRATGHSQPPFWGNDRLNSPEQPVVGVSWHDAVAYCKWAEKRLPTEAE